MQEHPVDTRQGQVASDDVQIRNCTQQMPVVAFAQEHVLDVALVEPVSGAPFGASPAHGSSSGFAHAGQEGAYVIPERPAHFPLYPQTESPIYFYNRLEPYYEFTNFALYSVKYSGKRYPTAEHLFQAHKFLETNPRLAEHIRRQRTPRAALQEATRLRSAQRRDWFNVNVAIMDDILQAKFRQHATLRDMLLRTGNRELIEKSPADSFWGSGADGRGRNEFGKCLMRLRDKLRAGG
ncbi:uncharacterized protein PHACADRAFT_149327 [Phanerochaete carnosa HHB-10118-sp]|uniref:NADAR domain-containing protein n=1 Tax=Phanerochaete carnosa (strain HHB-10118-sp) TaxID=650164 RepID=K5URP8_PHACS|nr:uncharacterized protein PHACADRAFT_149327 [Phanerochaete carnosa HHB-10118-sp]EKM52571.1 hypothetical protein PHACADRAFT_149327 [Phanerochaete carnosa HHB-10118-sp]